MAKETEAILTNNLYDNSVLVGDPFSHTNKVVYTKKAEGRNEVSDADPVAINFEGITVNSLILINRGTGTISYKLSGASANTGTLESGGMVVINGGNVSALEVATANVTPVEYEYTIFGI